MTHLRKLKNVEEMVIPFKDELMELHLPIGKYAIFGVALLSVKKIRASNDLDIIVKRELWTDFIRLYQQCIKSEPTKLHIGNIEIFKDWLNLSSKIDEMIDSAELIEGFPFVRIEYMLLWKKYIGRPKDMADIALIDDFNKKHAIVRD